MPRTPRNPGSGKPPHNGKARNQPATGLGWGGEAKGAGKRVDLAEVRPLRWDPANREQKEQVAAEMRGVLYHVALQGEAEQSRINAADKLLDRIEGKPVQRQDINMRTIDPDELTDEELAAIAARGRSGQAGGTPEDAP